MIRVINGLVSGEAKSRLVFWRWKNPLPGSRAYTVYAKDDPRFTDADVCREHGVSEAEKSDPKKQNAHWYGKVFYPMQDKPAVQQANHNYLFTRDYTAISFIMLITLSVAGFFIITSISTWLFYSVGLIAQYLLVRRAARNYGSKP
jgi:hypothetical protein